MWEWWSDYEPHPGSISGLSNSQNEREVSRFIAGVMKHLHCLFEVFVLMYIVPVFVVFYFWCSHFYFNVYLQISTSQGKTGGAERDHRALQETWQLGESLQGFDIRRLVTKSFSPQDKSSRKALQATCKYYLRSTLIFFQRQSWQSWWITLFCTGICVSADVCCR